LKKVLLLISALVLAVALTLPIVMPAMAHTEERPLHKELNADQTVRVGYVKVWNDNENLYVQFWMFPWYYWLLMKTDVHVATSVDDIPQTGSGNPKVGQFDYSEEHGSGVLDFTYVIPLGDWDADTQLYIAAHADVYHPCTFREETAWGGCLGQIPFPGRNWATYFTYTVQ